MISKAGRLLLYPVVAISLMSGAACAQTTFKPRTLTPTTPATPFDRTMRPLLGKLKFPSAAVASKAQQARANDTDLAAPNFGGYVSAPAYAARASNSIEYDSLNNGVQVELTADFDKDGLPDIAVLQFDGTLNILHNQGGGVLAAPAGYINPNPNVGSENVTQGFVADLNGDGYPDVVAFDNANDVVLTWLNAGDGTFKTAQTTVLSTNYGGVAGIAVADVNGDGKPDVVVAYSNQLSRTSSQMSIQTLVGVGDGTFTALNGATVAVPANLQLSGFNPIALGDLNGDGKADIAALFEEQTGQFEGNIVVTTALGNGDGTFAALGVNSPITAPVAGFPFLEFNTDGVQILDLNNDGKADVETDMDGEMYVALGQGNGSFSTQVSSVFPGSGGTVFVDMNGDGYLDAISANASLGIWLGNGDGTFATPTVNAQYGVDLPSPGGMVAADFDGDKKMDLAVLGPLYKEVSVFAGNGDGTVHGALELSLPTDWFTADDQLENVVQATAKPYSDLVIYSYESSSLVTGLSDGKGNFTYVPSLGTGLLPADFNFIEPVQADLNGDGLEDLVLTGVTGELWVSLSNGDGSFAAPVAAAMPTLSCPLQYAAAGDVNGDGKLDVVVAYPGDTPCGGSTYASGFFVLAGNGDGTFKTPVFYPAGAQLYSATLADVNLDGTLDLVLDDLPQPDSGTDQVTLQLGNGNGTFGAASTIVANYIVSDVKVADLNQDGNPDILLAAEEVVGSDVSTGGLLLIDGNGDGTFGARTVIGEGNFFIQTQVVDVNGDSIPDIETTLYQTNGQPNTYFGFSTLLGLGKGSFSAPINELQELDGALPQAGNFYADNAPDFVTSTPYGINLYLGQGGTSITLAASAASVPFGTAETLTATIAAAMSTRPTPTGTVSFYDGTTLLGSASVSGGTATLTAPSLATGTHSITAVYSGDSSFNLNTSGASAVTVTTLTPAFTLSGSPATLSLQQGGTGLVALSMTANATFGGTVTLTCSGAPADTSCGFTASSVTLTAGGTSSATLVVGTTGTKAALTKPHTPWSGTAPLVSVASLLALCFVRRRRLALPALLAFALLAILTAGATGCNGGGGPTVASSGVTTFTVVVTATPTGSAGMAQTTSVNVTVQ